MAAPSVPVVRSGKPMTVARVDLQLRAIRETWRRQTGPDREAAMLQIDRLLDVRLALRGGA